MSTEKQIVIHEQPQERALLTKAGLEASAEQLRLLEEYVKSVLKEDQDYGVIPGTKGKPTLLKPGAANITAAFFAHAEPVIETETVDPDKGYVAYRCRVDIVSNQGAGLLARGFGSCSSYEAKYRYRNAQPTCPSCGRENIRRSKDGGWYCWQKTGGCGASYPAADQRIAAQPVGRVINEDPLEQANTILKIAIKRAEVDAATRLPGVARFFTQDLEDMQPTPDNRPPAPEPATATIMTGPAVHPTPAPVNAPSEPVAQGPTLAQRLDAAVKRLGCTEEVRTGIGHRWRQDASLQARLALVEEYEALEMRTRGQREALREGDDFDSLPSASQSRKN